jgi:2-phospho-L-lactate/phosphoenolpyruvate guanylyltransferase
MPASAYVVLLPVKAPARAKSRLDVHPSRRRTLAAAFALDTAGACLATPSVRAVLAVTDDARFAAELRETGCRTVPDGVSHDLNECLRLAAAEAMRRWPDGVPVAVCADLPALLPADLESALSWGSGPRFVADHEQVGTTLYTAPYGVFAPRFGPGSRQAHLDRGAADVPGDLASLRLDVDDARALAAAEALGVGMHTRVALL